jgi:hypothetical protein
MAIGPLQRQGFSGGSLTTASWLMSEPLYFPKLLNFVLLYRAAIHLRLIVLLWKS